LRSAASSWSPIETLSFRPGHRTFPASSQGQPASRRNKWRTTALILLLTVGVTYAPELNACAFTASESSTGSWPIHGAQGDFNSDGKPDIAVANYLSDNISIFLGTTGGGFGAPVHYAAGDGPIWIEVA
jgi:hypothetical protein